MFNKWLKACSVLPALLITPAFSGLPVNVLPGVEETTEDNIYENNEVASGSGVYEVGGILNVANGTVFKNNKGDIGGAISVLKKSAGNPTGGLLNVGENVVFEGNTAIYDGGAIGNYGGSIISKNVTFRDNHSGVGLDGSETLTDNNPIGGGAISLGIDAVLDITNGNFEGNTSAYDGGAIGTRRTLVSSEVTGFDNIAHSINIKNTSFSNNEAKGITADTKNGNFAGGNGGAIATTFKNASISDSEFVGNVAAANGGAIYNHKLVATTSGTPTGLGGILSLNNNVFKSNKANKGGAIYNDSTISLTGDTQFVENSASNTGGAIFNASEGVITEISNALFQGNKAENYKDAEAELKKDVYAQGGAIYNRGSIGAINGDFINNSAHTKSETASKATANGGALALYQSTIESITGNFVGNAAIAEIVGKNHDYSDEMVAQDKLVSAGGGAIHIEGQWATGETTKIGSINGNFVNNSATGDAYANGGAIYIKAGPNTDVSIDKITGDFINNKVVAVTDNKDIAKTSTGGAISIKEASGKNATVEVEGDFGGNSVTTNVTTAQGGAVYNEGTFTAKGNFQNNLAFSNTGKVYGGALYNKGTANITGHFVNNAAQSENNVSGFGGAIFNDGDLTLAENTTFYANRSDNAGGALYNSGNIAELKGMRFQNNYSSMGGAINNANLSDLGQGTIGSISDSYFYGNIASNGGAIRNQGVITSIADTVFEYNQGGNGGALWNGTLGQIDTVEKIENAAFINNTALTGVSQQGGAITNAGKIGMIDGVLFDGNKAGKKGGAIANVTPQDSSNPEKVSEITFNGVTFTNNVAGVEGGAIYNKGAITFQGDNVFAGNTAAGVANDIHNLGSLTFADGTTIIGGGITGTGSLDLNEGATLNIGANTINQGTMNINGNVAASIVNSQSYGKLVGDLTVGDSAELTLNIGATGVYNIFADEDLEIANLTINANDALYNVSMDGSAIVVETKAVEEIAAATNLAVDTAGVLAGLANSDSYEMGIASLVAQQALAEGNTEYVEAESAKLKADDKPVTHSVATSVQNQVLSLASGRMSGNANVGRSGGDLANADYGVWAQGLFNKSKLNGQFDGYTRGVAVGADTLIDGKYTIGIGYAYNSTDVHAESARDTDIESNSVFVYGQYKPAQWYVNAALNYTMADYTETTNAFGVDINSEYDVTSFGGQVAAGYDFASGLTPEAGVRYLHVSQDDYNNGLADIKVGDTDYLTGVAGVKYAFNIDTEKGLSLRPELRAAATYDVLSDEAIATVTMPGAASYIVDSKRLSRLGGEFGIGLTANYKGVEVSLNYDLDLHEDYTSQTGMLKFRYNF